MSNKTNLTNSDQSAVSSNEDGTMSKYSDYQRSSASFNSSEMSRDTNKNREGSSGIGTSISSNSNRNSSSHSHSHHQTSHQFNQHEAAQQQATKAQRLFVKRVELLDELKSLLSLQHTNNSANNNNNNNNNTNQPTTTTITTTTTTTTTIKTKPTDSSSSIALSSHNKNQDNINQPNKSIKISCNSSLAVDDEGNSKLSSTTSTTKKQTISTIQQQQNDYDIDNIVISAIQYIKSLQQKNEHKNLTSEDQTTSNRNNNNPLILSPNSNTSSSSSSNINKIELITKINKIEDMCISILVKTGMIVYANEKLTNLLGFPANSWLGKRPIDFLYKNDSNLLLTKLCDLTYKINNSCYEKTVSDIEIEPFYLRFKRQILVNNNNDDNNQINTNTSDESANEATVAIQSNQANAIDMPLLVFKNNSKEYIAFKIELKADKVEINKNINLNNEKTVENYSSSSTAARSSSSNNELLLTTLNNSNINNNKDKLSDSSTNSSLLSNHETSIIFKFSYPQIAYLQELDNFTERSFISQHDINLRILRVDNTVTELLGFLPQDLEKKSFLKFIHPDDLERIRQIHYDIYDGKEGQNQEIYRWRCFNGSYVTVKTNWSWFIHPWKKQIDFIIGKHLVLNEPLNKNIFEENHKHFDSKKKELRIESNNNKELTTVENASDKLKKIETEIIDYISKKIPGMDDATQILGEDVIRLIKKKNISASYCQEQYHLLKSSKKQSSINKPYRFTPSKQIYQYPQYFQPAKYFKHKHSNMLKDPKLSNLIKFNPSLPKHLISRKHLDSNIDSSSKTKSNNKIDTTIATSSGTGNTTPAVTLDTKINLEKKQLYEISEETDNVNNSASQQDTKLTQQLIQQQQQHQRILDQQLLSKKSVELSILKEKGFFQNYTICKYLESLPSMWKPTDLVNNENNIQIMSDEVTAAAVNVCIDLDEPMVSPEVAVIAGSTRRNETIVSNLNEQFTKQPQVQTVSSLQSKTSFKRPFETIINQTDQDAIYEQNEIMFKKGSSYSSKSHSKIVLIDENDNDEEEETAGHKSTEQAVTPNKDLMISPKMNLSTLVNNTMNLNTSPTANTVDKNFNNLGITFTLNQNKEPQMPLGLLSVDLNNIQSVSNQNFNNNNNDINRQNNFTIKQQNSPFNQFDSSSNQFSSNMSISMNIGNNNIKPTENYFKLTKENLARFTREQDEIYTMCILRKVQRPIKMFSESPQNICAQAPNVFSRNEYEPPLKRTKLLISSDQNLKDRVKQTLAETSSGSVEVHQRDVIDSYNTSGDTTGPYNVVVGHDVIDCDNPQKYHEIFHKKIDQDHKCKQSPLMEDNQNLLRSNKINERNKNIDVSQKIINEKNSNHSNENALIRTTTTNNKTSSRGNTSGDEDIINFWKKCMRHGSAITKRLKECENLFKIIGNLSKNEPEMTNLNMNTNNSQVVMDITNNNKNSTIRYKRELKKRLYIVAGLLGINLEIGSNSGKNITSGEDSASSAADESNKSSDILDQYIRKIQQELLHAGNEYPNNTTTSQSITSSSTSSKHVITSSDPNSIDLLSSIYDDLKLKFISQFHRFNQQKMPLNYSSSSLFRSSTTENNEEDVVNQIMNQTSSSLTTNNHKSNNNNNNNNNKNHNSPGGGSRSPNDYEFLSNNEFDDSSTYLFDSPTTSFETNSSNEKQEKNNKKSNIQNLPISSSQIKKSNSESNNNLTNSTESNTKNSSHQDKTSPSDSLAITSSSNSNSSGEHRQNKQTYYDEYFDKANMFHLSSDASRPVSSHHQNYNHIQKISDNSTNMDSDETNNNNNNQNSNNNSYDDRLCVTLMQNYIDLFKNKNQQGGDHHSKNDSQESTIQFSNLPDTKNDEKLNQPLNNNNN